MSGDNSSISVNMKRKTSLKLKDILRTASTYLFSSFSIVALIAIVIFVFSKGYSTLSLDFLFGDYQSVVYNVETNVEIIKSTNEFSYEAKEDEYFSTRWGIAFKDEKDNEGLPIVSISYVDSNSNTNNWIDSSDSTPFSIREGLTVSSVQLWTTDDKDTASVVVLSSSDGALAFEKGFDSCDYLKVMTLSYGGGGIRGSLISTLYMILITMSIALPLGILAALFLGVFADKMGKTVNRLSKFLRNMIDMITGIPSIIFGLVGGVIFLPFVGGKGNLISGSLTLACMILPIIIKSTEESIRTIPKSMSLASLALGASETETAFKIVIPNALPGILTSALLGIGRVIGESAALIYTSGASIQDYIIPTKGSATLAVHIWSLMSGDSQNIEASCAVSIVILFVILVLSILIKIVSSRFIRFQKGK